MASIIEHLEGWAASQPEKRLFSFLDADGKETDRYSFLSFHRATCSLADYLARHAGLRYGDRVLLAYPPGLDMIVAFCACARLGVISVPVAPPKPSGLDAGLSKLAFVASDCQATVALTTSRFYESFNLSSTRGQSISSSLPMRLRWVTTDDIPTEPIDRFAGATNPVLFLQYTSGSTSDPKGVIVTHENVVHNGIATVTESPVGVSWLPQYHDMGLIGFYLFALVVGGTTHGFSPLAFLKRPALWLQTISRVKATYGSSPNFGFDYCLQPGKILDEDLRDVDLGSLRVLINAAEPVRAETYRAFYERFRPYGLRSDATMSAYGLAEATLAATRHGRRIAAIDKRCFQQNVVRPRTDVAGQNGVVRLVSCGTALPDLQIRIVDPGRRTAMREAQIGEIWISGPSVCEGYWNRPGLTREVFGNTLSGRSSDGPYLRTGDLGFFQDGELFVCGRIKDLIIVRGVNHYPQDIEAVVESASSEIRRGGVVAFSGDTDREALVVVAEVRHARDLPDPAGIAHAIRTGCHVEPDTIVLVPARTIARTTSGKTARRPTRERYLEGTLTALLTYRKPSEPACGERLDRLKELVEHLSRLRADTGREGMTLAEAGIDSLRLVQLLVDLEDALEARGAGDLIAELDVPLLQQLTVAELSHLLALLETMSESTVAECCSVLRRARSEHEGEIQARMRRDAAAIPHALDAIEMGDGDVASVLLTGATGFFGPFLLSSLLRHTPHTYYVLTRATDAAHGAERIRRALCEANLATPDVVRALESRVRVLCGNIAQERLGLCSDQWASLTRDVGAVCHNAALVNYVLNYDTHRPHNVDGTRELLHFAHTTRRKAFHFVSSTFIFGWTMKGLLLESDNNDQMMNLDFGYAQSKWVAEQLVLAAGRHGLTVRIYRPSLISVSSQGVGDDKDAAIRLLAFMINHGLGIESSNQVSILPADLAADNLAALVAERHPAGGTFHLTADRYYNIMDLTRVMTRDHGYRFEYHDIPRFVDLMNRRCTEGDLLYPLLDFFNRSSSKIAAMQLKRYSNDEYRRAREQCGVARAEPSLEETVSYLLTYMRRRGLIGLPS